MSMTQPSTETWENINCHTFEEHLLQASPTLQQKPSSLPGPTPHPPNHPLHIPIPVQVPPSHYTY